MSPKDPGPAYCLNPDCGKPIGRSTGSGRPRHYCNDACGRAYRRARERHPTPDTLAHNSYANEVADDLVHDVEQLRRLARAHQPLDALSLILAVERDLEDLKAALVQQARDQREKNAEIARSLHLPPDQLTRKLSSEAVRRRMANRERQPRNRPSRPAPDADTALAAIRIPRQRRPPAVMTPPRPGPVSRTGMRPASARPRYWPVPSHTSSARAPNRSANSPRRHTFPPPTSPASSAANAALPGRSPAH